MRSIRKKTRKRVWDELRGPHCQSECKGSDLDRQLDAKEPLQIHGSVTAFINGQKELTMSFVQYPSGRDSGGISMKLRTMWW
jgi:hypothetical protein